MACLLSNIFAPTKAKGQKMSNEIHRCIEVSCHYSAIEKIMPDLRVVPPMVLGPSSTAQGSEWR